MKVLEYAKAGVAALAAGSGALVTAMADDKVSNGEWLFVALTVLAALGITAWVPNKTPASPRSTEFRSRF